MIEVNNISFSYPGQKERVFDGFSLRVEESKIYGLLGKNGTGKSQQHTQHTKHTSGRRRRWRICSWCRRSLSCLR